MAILGFRCCMSRAMLLLRPVHLQLFQNILVQPAISDGSVIALKIGILLWLPRLDKLQSDPTLLGPGRQRRTDFFRTIIAPNRTANSAPLHTIWLRQRIPRH